MQKNKADQKIRIFACDITTGLGKTGIADTITAYLSKDSGAAAQTDDVHPTEVDAANLPGAYDFTMTLAETDCYEYWLQASTTEPNVEIDPVKGQTIDVAAIQFAADSVAGRICTLADVKDRLGLGTTEYDSVINRIIAGVEAIFDSYTMRKLILNDEDETLYWTGSGGQRIILPRYPIVSITSIKEAIDWNFADADALVENTDFRIVAERFLYRAGLRWPMREDSIEIKYKGGYVPAGQSPGENETAMPADLREAAILQATFIYERRNSISQSANSFQGGSVTFSEKMDLLPMVKNVLDNYKRLIL